MLSYSKVKRMAASVRGLNDTTLVFEYISSETDEMMPKGLFIPFSEKDLFEAIHKGAIASLWQKGKELPAWLPNHFPIFITENMTETVLTILDDYYYNTKQEEWGTMTKFIFRNEEKGKLYKISEQEQYSKLKKLAETTLMLRGGE